jgi:restriction endonuclease-like protein
MAVLSHTSAAWLWGLLSGCPAPAHVTVPKRGHDRHSIHLHYASGLNDTDRDIRERIPVTALPRTLLDLAATTPRRLDRAIERSEQLRLFDLPAVDSLLARSAGHPGCGRLRRALDAYREPAFTRSFLERRFLPLLRKAGLPVPAVNTFVDGFEIDMYWAHERFAIELDGWETHRSRAAFERDRLRQEELKLAGIEMVRITYGRIAREPEAVVKRVAALLEHRRKGLARRTPQR